MFYNYSKRVRRIWFGRQKKLSLFWLISQVDNSFCPQFFSGNFKKKVFVVVQVYPSFNSSFSFSLVMVTYDNEHKTKENKN